jgi:ribose transport system ATP-binding protein
LTGVSKSYPGVKALTDVHLDCLPGEVHALVGENGSGKSTLIKIASGVLALDAGEVLIGGEPLTRASVHRARRLGLMTAYQDTSLVAELTAAQNIALSFNAIGEPCPPRIDRILERFQLPFRSSATVAALGPGARQLLEVARVMCHAPRVLLLDEPTAALDLKLAAHLEELINQARDEGVAIVYVSHRLAEVRRLADRLTVIRDGVIQGTDRSRAWNVEDVVELMVGAPTELEFPKRPPRDTDTCRLEVRGLAGAGFGPVGLKVHAGEIVGIAGAEGNGQRALLRGLIGIGRTAGEIAVDGAPLRRVDPPSALDAGISFQSGDRALESVYTPLSVMDNSTAQMGADSGPFGLALAGRLLYGFRRASDELGIVAASPYQPISGLSGGNQQKAVLARPALRPPKVLVIDEPTQGVDAGARIDIYRVLAGAAEDGLGVLVNSSDSAELAGLCDRVYVMSRGAVVNELVGQTSENEIVQSFVGATGAIEGRDAAESSRAGFARRALAHLSTQVPIIVLVVLLTLVALYTGSRSDLFWSQTNLTDLLIATIPLGMVALGEQFTMLSGGMDISVGSTMSLTVVLVSMTLPGFGAGSVLHTALVLALATVAIGGLNAFLIGALKINSIVATIATMGIVLGVAIVLRPQPAGTIAPSLATAFTWGPGFVPLAFIILAGLAVALEVWLYRSRAGLAVRAIGFSPEASRRLGWGIGRVRSIGLVVCAAAAVVAGIALASQVGIGENNVGQGYTLTAFAAAFLGGAVMTGGRGSFVGAVLGALFLSLLNNAAPLLNISTATTQLLDGIILLVAVASYATANRLRSRRSHR